MADVAAVVEDDVVRGVRVDDDPPVSAAAVESALPVDVLLVLVGVKSAAVVLASADPRAFVIVELSLVSVAEAAEESKVVLPLAAKVG